MRSYQQVRGFPQRVRGGQRLGVGDVEGHTGDSSLLKGGEQRGTSRREDVLDTSIRLRHPSDYSVTEGARFEVHIAKGRGIHGEDARPFEARLKNDEHVWTMREIEDLERTRVAELLATGMSVRDIAEEIGISKSGVHRLKRRIEQDQKAENAAKAGSGS